MQHAVRQGDVLIRPIRHKIEAVESKIDWMKLRHISNAHMEHVKDTREADRMACHVAVRELYRVLGRNPPRIMWFTGESIEPSMITTPIRTTIELIQAVVQYQLLDLDVRDATRVMNQLGYDGHLGTFRLASSKRLLSRDIRLRSRNGTRPPWTIDLGNLICQFDRSPLIMYDLAKTLVTEGIIPPLPSTLTKTADAILQVLNEAFGILLFEDSCILLDRPLTISLNPAQQLSNTQINPADMMLRTQDCPAYEPRFGQLIFAVNGIRIPIDTIIRMRVAQGILFSVISNINPLIARSAAINYVSWETFFDNVPKRSKREIDASRFGDLWVIQAGSQDIYVVRVTNSTAEPDGSFRRFVIPVDPQCRPIPNPADPSAVLGRSQALTALNAVASTFGLTGEEYEAQLGAES